MAEFIVEGGHKLKGSIIPQGAKNESIADSMCGASYLGRSGNQ